MTRWVAGKERLVPLARWCWMITFHPLHTIGAAWPWETLYLTVTHLSLASCQVVRLRVKQNQNQTFFGLSWGKLLLLHGYKMLASRASRHPLLTFQKFLSVPKSAPFTAAWLWMFHKHSGKGIFLILSCNHLQYLPLPKGRETPLFFSLSNICLKKGKPQSGLVKYYMPKETKFLKESILKFLMQNKGQSIFFSK